MSNSCIKVAEHNKSSSKVNNCELKMCSILIVILLIATEILHSGADVSANSNQSSIATGKIAASDCPSHDDFTSVCASDCKTIVSCAGQEVINTFRCSDLSTQFPYCIPNTFGCSSQLDPQYETCTPFVRPEFVCTSDGYFPNPDDCNEFFICRENIAYNYKCPPNYVYDTSKTECKLKQGVADCITINCIKENAYAVHYGNRAFYGFCSVVDCVAHIIMFRCANRNGHVFNPDNFQCEFECSVVGRFPGETNCQEFYECYWVEDTQKLAKQILSCPGSYIFDSITQTCVPGTC